MTPRRLRLAGLGAVLLALAALALGACGDDGDGDESRETVAAGATEQAVPPRPGGARLVRVRAGLGDALYVTAAPGEPERLYIVRQSGTILTLQGGRLRTFLNLSRRISAGGEQGLLGLAFHPRYARNGRFFVNYTDRAGDTQVVEYRRAGRAARANPASARRLLSIEQPYANHNGGHLAFGPDRMLYIGTGDGGSGGDPHGNGQSVDTLLGKLLRIDVNRRTGRRPYGIPAGNPFARGGGRPEIYAYGLRNPWRFSFDRRRGDLWIGDVGQNAVEEIDFVRRGAGAGANFGWNAFEGRSAYSRGGSLRGGRQVAPVAQYSHDLGVSVTGGYVYRGSRVPSLRGRYLYADYGTGRIWAMRAGPRPGAPRELTGRLGVALSGVTSFGEDAAGELYVIANQSLYRLARR